MLAFSLAIGNHFIAADHGARSRADTLGLAAMRLWPTSGRRGLPERRHAVRGHGGVHGDQRQGELLRLGDHETVERIALMQREIAHRPHLAPRYGDPREAELGDGLRQVRRGFQLSDEALDGDLPQADVAHAEPEGSRSISSRSQAGTRSSPARLQTNGCGSSRAAITYTDPTRDPAGQSRLR